MGILDARVSRNKKGDAGAWKDCFTEVRFSSCLRVLVAVNVSTTIRHAKIYETETTEFCGSVLFSMCTVVPFGVQHIAKINCGGHSWASFCLHWRCSAAALPISWECFGLPNWTRLSGGPLYTTGMGLRRIREPAQHSGTDLLYTRVCAVPISTACAVQVLCADKRLHERTDREQAVPPAEDDVLLGCHR